SEALGFLDRLSRRVPQRVALEPWIAHALRVDPYRHAERVDRFPERPVERIAEIGAVVARGHVGDLESELPDRALKLTEREPDILQRQHAAADEALRVARHPGSRLVVAAPAQRQIGL